MTSLSVGIPTFRRNRELFALLRQLLDTLPHGVPIYVGDNSPSLEAREVITALDRRSSGRVVYLPVPIAGVVHARNAILKCVATQHVVFIDDDQVLEENWYEALSEGVARYPEAILAGRVTYLTREDSDQYVAEWLQRRVQYADWARVPSTGTGNTVFPLEHMRALGLVEFDSRFNNLGGEDTHLIGRFAKRGVEIRACNGMAVSEWVEPERLTKRWIRKRLMREGMVRVVASERSPMYAGIEGAARVASGGVRLVVGRMVKRRASFYDEARFFRGVGMLRLLALGPMEEYGVV